MIEKQEGNIKIEKLIGVLLTIGTLISALIVLVGGIEYLVVHGNESLRWELLQSNVNYASVSLIFHSALALSPVGIIAIGILSLIATQVMRVALLVLFYIAIKDYWFVAISFFVLMVLVCSFILNK